MDGGGADVRALTVEAEAGPDMAALEILFLGTGGAVPTPQRGLPATMVIREGERLLFDCGEGTQRQMMRCRAGFDVSRIFITHFHADHYLGIPGMLQTMDFQDREDPVEIVGPVGTTGLWGIMEHLGCRNLGFDVVVEEVTPGDVLDYGEYSVRALEGSHAGTDVLGYALEEAERPGRFDRERAVELGVEPGPDFSRLQRGEAVETEGGAVEPEEVVGEARRGRAVVISGDTRPVDAVAEAAEGADVLIHDATLSDAEEERARKVGHATAREAAEVARDAGVRFLALTHLSSRFSADPRKLLREAEEVFTDVLIPDDFTRVEVPYPEKERGIRVIED